MFVYNRNNAHTYIDCELMIVFVKWLTAHIDLDTGLI